MARVQGSPRPGQSDRAAPKEWAARAVQVRKNLPSLSAVTPVSHNPIYSACPSCSQQATLETSPLHDLPTNSTTATAGRTASRGRLNTRVPHLLRLTPVA